MTKQPREFTMSEYFGAIRRHRSLILIVTLLCTAVGLGLSLAQKKTYSATATLAVGDPNAPNNVVGGGSVLLETPLQLASAYSPQVTRQEVVNRVKQVTGTTLSTNALQNAVGVAIDPNSYALQITANARNPQQAARIANAFANADASITTGAARAQYRAQAKAVSKSLKKASQSEQLLTVQTLSRLQQLSAVVTPLSVSQPATVPTGPSSPKTARNTLAGLGLGLLLGIALAFGRDAFDRRVRKVSDITEELDHPIVGNIPSTALGTPRPPGKKQRKTAQLLSERNNESFRILRQNVSFLSAQQADRIVLVTSGMPQEGKSSVAAGLALAMAQAGKRTLLVDCDLRRPVIAERLGLKQTPGLTDFLTGHAQPHEILQVVPMTQLSPNGNGSGPQIDSGEATNLVCISSGSHVPLPAEMLDSEGFRAFIKDVGEAYEAVVLDTAPLLTIADTLGILPAASAVLLCVRLGRTTRDQTHAAQAALDRLPSRPVALVVTDVKDQETGYYAYYRAPQSGAQTPTGVR
jgi:Mrp family chromosome partitioning ATPase/capsular polysaccharide biosynthesis protein